MHVVHNPPVPGVIALHEQIHDGSKIDIHGHVEHGHHHNFTVELLSGPHVVLHIDFRFQHEHEIVMNSFSHNAWGMEVRHHNPLRSGDHFHLHIHCKHHGYDIELNGHHLAHFPHRHNMSSVQVIGLKGGVHVKEVKFHGFHFRHSWGHGHATIDFGHGGYNGYGTSSYNAPVFNGGHTYNAYW